MRTIDIHDAKSHLFELVEQAARGASFLIAISGRPRVMVIPVEALGLSRVRPPGFLAECVLAPEDFDRMGRQTAAVACPWRGADDGSITAQKTRVPPRTQSWASWVTSLGEFSTDFMEDRDIPVRDPRGSQHGCAEATKALPTSANVCRAADDSSMTTMNIALADLLKDFVDQQVRERGYGTSREYVRELICRDQDRSQRRANGRG
jgi:antitoxin (DNA-binding transcriptional repressor) of toxin-antitoxin stability system